VLAPADRVGRVLLRDDAVGEVMRVLVTLTVADPGSSAVAGVPQMGGHRPGQPGPDVGGCRVDRLDHRVRLGRQRQVDRRLGRVARAGPRAAAGLLAWITRLHWGPGAGWFVAWARWIRAPASPTTPTACAAATATPSADGSAIPTSSLACTISRLAMKRGSSPASIILAR